MIMKKENLINKKSMIAIAIALILLIAVSGTFASDVQYPAGNDNAGLEKNIAEEGIGGSAPSDESKYVFLDSYFESERGNTSAEEENIAEEGIGGSTLSDESQYIFLDSYYETKTETLDANSIGILAQYNINWDIAAGRDVYGVSQLSMSQGARVRYSISWSPQPGVIRVGLYNRNTGRFFWAASSASSPLSGTITVPETGLYSFAVGNTTDTAVVVTGHFIY